MATNQIVELGNLYDLLNAAMQENAMEQGSVGTTLSQGLSQTSELLSNLNNDIAEIQSKITHLADKKATTNWVVIGLSVVAGVCAFAVPAFGLVGGLAVAGTMTASVAGMAAGGAGVAEGTFTIQLANCTGDLAPKNGLVTGLNGEQQSYMGASKWATGQMSETFTRMGDMAKTIVEGTKKINEGIRMSGQDVVRGVLHSRS